jgi:hypothetical protein
LNEPEPIIVAVFNFGARNIGNDSTDRITAGVILFNARHADAVLFFGARNIGKKSIDRITAASFFFDALHVMLSGRLA